MFERYFSASVVTFNRILSHMTLNVTLTLRRYRSQVPIIILKLRCYWSLQTKVTLKLRRYSSLLVNVALIKKRYRTRQLNVTLKLISKLWEALVKALGIPMTLFSYWPTCPRDTKSYILSDNRWERSLTY